MKILHVVPSYYPAVRYGGPIRSVHGLASALARSGHDVHVYTTSIDGEANSDVAIGRPVERDGVKVWYFAAGLGRRLFRAPAMAAALQANVAYFDIVHLHSVFLWPTTIAARVARARGIPYVLAPRGMLVRDLIERKSGLAKRAWIAAFERANLAGAAAIHATSQIERAELEACGLTLPPIAVIANGLDPPAGEADAANAWAEAAGQPRPVLFLGRVNWKKGLDRLIPAMRHLPGVDLVVAGNDEEGYRPKLEALARQVGVAERVRFIGPVDAEAKWALLRSAAVLALPSYSENFGIVVLEAMSVGCPVVVTPEVGLSGEVQASGAGIVTDGEPQALGAALRQVLDQPAVAHTMAQAGRRAVAERFSWSAIAQQTHDLYRSIQRTPQRSSHEL